MGLCIFTFTFTSSLSTLLPYFLACHPYMFLCSLFFFVNLQAKMCSGQSRHSFYTSHSSAALIIPIEFFSCAISTCDKWPCVELPVCILLPSRCSKCIDTVRKSACMLLTHFGCLNFIPFPHDGTISLAKYSSVTFTNVLET